MFSPPPELSPRWIDLWLLPTPLSGDEVSYFESLLTAEETERFARFRFAEKRNEAIASRGLLRHVLSFALKTPAQQVALTLGVNGKPGVAGSRIRFNLSHTAGRVLLAATLDHELGVDIERIRERTCCEDLARRYFTPGEHAGIMALPAAPAVDRLRAFFVCWTRKESLLKATGQGIAAGLHTFEVPICPFSGSMEMSGGWHLRDVEVGPGFVAALATAACDVEVRWNWRPGKDFSS